MIKSENALESLINSLSSQNKNIMKHSLWILGNLLAEKEENALALQEYQILDKMFPLLNSNDAVIRKDACWAISNFSIEKNPSNQVAQNPLLFEKLIHLYMVEKDILVRTELGHIFSRLVAYADRDYMFEALLKEGII